MVPLVLNERTIGVNM